MTKRLWDNYVPNFDYNAVKKGIKRLNLDYYMRTLNFDGSFVFYHSVKGGSGLNRQNDFILYPQFSKQANSETYQISLAIPIASQVRSNYDNIDDRIDQNHFQKDDSMLDKDQA